MEVSKILQNLAAIGSVLTPVVVLILSGIWKTGTDLFFETGGRLHTAIREDASMNLAAIDDLQSRQPNLELVLVESGGDKLL